MPNQIYTNVERYSRMDGLARTLLMLLTTGADEYGWGMARHPAYYTGSINKLFQAVGEGIPGLREAGLTDVDISEVKRSIEYAVEMNELFYDTPRHTYKVNVAPPGTPKMLRMPDPGYVYILESRYGYKIGKTKDLPTRMNFFGVKLPFETNLVHTILSSNITRCETALHRAYAQHRIDGEWFSLSEKDITWLCGVSSLEPLAQ